MEDKLPVIGITMGDPAGIGPEIIVSAFESSDIFNICMPVVIGDAKVMEKAVSLKGSSWRVKEIDSIAECSSERGKIDVLALSSLDADYMEPGIPTAENGAAMISYIQKAADLAMAGEIAAMVTAPVTKTALKMSGSEFHGHTEMIADRTGSEKYAMMLAGEKLKVILVTIHIPLSEVSGRLSVDNVAETISITGKSMRNNFGIERPVVAVAGLNPHSGESAMFGDEEERIIIPAIRKAIKDASGEYVVEGPFPPDTVFYHAANGKFDCVVCMYHDQGLIPFKLLHFSDGVNTTLGLPIVRTSVDHGTAYDIAWQNKADHTSLVKAVEMAVLQAGSLNNRS